KREFSIERERALSEPFYDDFTKDFVILEGDSLRKCFISTLESMAKDKVGKIEWFKERIAIDLDGNHVELWDKEKIEIINIEKEICDLFEVGSRSELMYKNRGKLREYDLLLKEILTDRYGYIACYTVYQVIAKIGVKGHTIAKSLEEAKEKYGISESAEEILKACKDGIYDNRLSRARTRYAKRISDKKFEIDERCEEKLKDNWGDDDFVRFLREIELNEVESLESYITKWIDHYKKYIHCKEVEEDGLEQIQVIDLGEI
ncbi:MAG: hypothetical protein ACRDA3_12965, partial [Peptostreptococcaceae bacterium]